MTRGFQQLNTFESKAPAVLALHSLGSNGSSWQGVADAAGDERPFYVFDQLAHGAQAASAPANFQALVDDAALVLNDLPADQVHLVGHSIGGAVIAYLAAQVADPRVVSLTMVATPLKGSQNFLQRAHAVEDGHMKVACTATLVRWFDDDAPFAATEAAANALYDMRPAGFDACWRALAAFPGYAGLNKQAIPLQICSFENDRSTPPNIGTALADTLSSVFVVKEHQVIAGAGHMGVLTHPAELAAHLCAHWHACETGVAVGGVS